MCCSMNTDEHESDTIHLFLFIFTKTNNAIIFGYHWLYSHAYPNSFTDFYQQFLHQYENDFNDLF